MICKARMFRCWMKRKASKVKLMSHKSYSLHRFQKSLLLALLVPMTLLGGCASQKVTSCTYSTKEGSSIVLRLKAHEESDKAESLDIVMHFPLEYDETLTGTHIPLDETSKDINAQKKRLLQESVGSTLGINPDLIRIKEKDGLFEVTANVLDIPALFERFSLEAPSLDYDALKAELEQSPLFSCSSK